MANRMDKHSAEAFGTGLTAALREFRGGTIAQDDVTIIVLEKEVG